MYRIIGLIFLASIPRLSLANTPVVSIEYNQTLDSICSFFKGPKIEDAWRDELSQKLEGFRSSWDTDGAKLLATTEHVTGKSFSSASIRAYLSLCAIPSQSGFGKSVNMRYAMSTFIDDPVSFRYKVGTLYHEILHGFINEHLPENSKLLTLNEKEHPRVREHLHLLALMKSVYIELDIEHNLAEIIDIDGKLPGGFYKRTWEIINEREDTYKVYVDEISRKKS